MRDRVRDRCPQCNDVLVEVKYSGRTVPGGMWYVLRCHNCGIDFDAFRPRRSSVKYEVNLKPQACE